MICEAEGCNQLTPCSVKACPFPATIGSLCGRHAGQTPWEQKAPKKFCAHHDLNVSTNHLHISKDNWREVVSKYLQ